MSESNTKVRTVRAKVARLLVLAGSLLAAVLFVGALCVVFDANEKNDLVRFVLDTADRVDLGVFSREGGIKEFAGKNADAKNAMLNWGLGAVVWLVLGRVAGRLVAP